MSPPPQISSPLSSPLPTKAAVFLGRSEARDKLLKLIGYTIRMSQYQGVPKMLGSVSGVAVLDQIDKKIVDCRQLLNHFKYIHTLKILKGFTDGWTVNSDLLTNLSILRTLLWSMEVISSDLSYYAKHIMKHWDALRISKLYKIGKSLQLTVLIVIELMHIRKLRQQDGKETEIQKKIMGIVRCICDCVCFILFFFPPLSLFFFFFYKFYPFLSNT